MNNAKAPATPEWIIHRWKRHGRERLYARTPGGTDLGYFDVKADSFQATQAADLPLLQRAIADYLGTPSPIQAMQAPCGDLADPTSTPIPEAPWSDLSTVAPGAAVLEQAEIAMAEFRAKHRWLAFFGMRGGRSWRVGAAGEQAVAARLATLGPAWRVLHAVRVGTRGSDIDHVVIGPAGVFTVNTKNHPNGRVWVGGETFMVNGTRYPYVRNSRHEAQRASRLLTNAAGFPVHATAIIAIMGAHKGLKIKSQPKDRLVFVTARLSVARHLKRLPKRLTPQQVDAIYEVARRSTTWV